MGLIGAGVLALAVCGLARAQDTSYQARASELGIAYAPPSGWEILESQSSLPAAKQQASRHASSEEEKRGLACVEVELTARYGQPASVIVEVALPFKCFGQQMTETDLAGFAAGASDGLKQSFDLEDPVTHNYQLGSHHLWIERALGRPKGHPEMHYTVEITCGLLNKAAVCWMAMAADASALTAFEHGKVSLDDDKAATLVPPDTFSNKSL